METGILRPGGKPPNGTDADSGSSEHMKDDLRFEVLRGSRSSNHSAGEIRALIQGILGKAIKVSTLIGSGTSFGAVPLMSQTLEEYESRYFGNVRVIDRYLKSIGQPSKRDGGKITNLEAYLTWLSQVSEVETNEDYKLEYVRVIEAFTDPIFAIFAGHNVVNPEGGTDSPDSNHSDPDNVEKVLSGYQRLIQGLGASREILARQSRSLFDIVNLFTTNYDLFHELALVESGYLYSDGFSSGIRNEFSVNNFHLRPLDLEDRFRDRLQPVNPFFRLFKLHGSIDWRLDGGSNSSSGGSVYRVPMKYVSNDDETVLVKPINSKYIVSQGVPFSDIFREFVNILGEPDNVLFVHGYGFGDEHINNLLFNALQRSDFLIYVFIGRSDMESENVDRFIGKCRQLNATFIRPRSDHDGAPEFIGLEQFAAFFEPDNVFSDKLKLGYQ